MIQIHRLAVLDRFQCLAGECPDTCCAGWDTELDVSTRRRWEQLPELERDALLQTVTLEQRPGQTTPLLAKDANGSCVHLNAERLCHIQIKHGPEHLPVTCRYFPRLRCDLPWRRYDSASLSCPEIARLVLSEAHSEQLFNTSSVPGELQSRLLPANALIAHALTRLVEAVLAERRFPLNVRIYFLGWTLREAALLSQEGRLGNAALKTLCAPPRPRLYEINLAIKAGRIKAPTAMRIGFWRWLFNLAQERGLSFAPEATERLENGLTTAATSVGAPLFEGEEQARLQVRESYGQALENYLAVTFVNNGFPFAPHENNYIATFLQAILPFACVQLQLWLIAADAGALEDRDIIRAVQRSERRFGHSNALYRLFSEQPRLLLLDPLLPVLAELY